MGIGHPYCGHDQELDGFPHGVINWQVFVVLGTALTTKLLSVTTRGHYEA
jgi:hypothetical protein